MPPKKPKLPADHPQKRKRKPKATPSPLTGVPDGVGSRPAIDFRSEPTGGSYAPSTPYFADITGVPYSRTDEYPAYWVDAPNVPAPESWREWLSRKLTALAKWVAP